MRAVGVGVFLVPEGGALRPVLRRADAVAPVVAFGEAAARPAQHRCLDRPHGVDERLPDAVGVADLRLLADPHAVVDHAAEVLDEVGVDLGRNGADRLRRKDVDPSVHLGSGGLRQ